MQKAPTVSVSWWCIPDSADSFHYARSLLSCEINFKEQNQIYDLMRMLVKQLPVVLM